MSKRHPDTLLSPRFVRAHASRKSVNGTKTDAKLQGEIDLVSVHTDGNDCRTWEVLDCIQPRVAIVETHVKFGDLYIVAPYDPACVRRERHPHYHGAAPSAMAELGARERHRLVGSSRIGFDTPYVKNDEGVQLIPTLPVSAVLRHCRN